MSTERGGGPESSGDFFNENDQKSFLKRDDSPRKHLLAGKDSGKLAPAETRKNKPIPPPPYYDTIGMARIGEFLEGNVADILGNQHSIPDRPAKLDPHEFTHRIEALNEIFRATEGNPEKIKIVDLVKIIDAEKKDLLTQQNSFDRITAATVVAKEFFADPTHPRKIHVSLEQNDEGGWTAKLHARKGKLYHTLTPSGIVNGRLMLVEYLQELDSLDSANEAVEKMIKGENLDANEDDTQALYQFMIKKLREAINTVDHSDTIHLIANATATRILLEKMALRVFSYPTSKPQTTKVN